MLRMKTELTRLQSDRNPPGTSPESSGLRCLNLQQIHGESKNMPQNSYPYLRQIFTDFQTPFSVRLGRQLSS